MKRLRSLLLDASGAVADLGVLIPITAALVIQNGFDAGTVLIGVGGLYLVAGLYFRVPVPVQPIKAASAIAIAQGLPPQQLSIAAVFIGLILLVIGLTKSTRFITAVFSLPLVRGVQLGVGLILVDAALGLGGDSGGYLFFLGAGAIALALIVVGLTRATLPLALLVVAAGMGYTTLQGAGVSLQASLWQPEPLVSSIQPSMLWGVLLLLVVPQIPLTLGNAVVAVNDVEKRYFGPRARRVTPRRICFSSGIANVAAGAFTGMPMCHGSGGLTAHHRAGARTFAMNVLIGGALLVLGLFFGSTAFALLTMIPLVVLAGLLAFTGTMHSFLVADLRGYELLIALAMGLVGLVTTNLAVALALGLILYWPIRWTVPSLLGQEA